MSADGGGQPNAAAAGLQAHPSKLLTRVHSAHTRGPPNPHIGPEDGRSSTAPPQVPPLYPKPQSLEPQNPTRH